MTLEKDQAVHRPERTSDAMRRIRTRSIQGGHDARKEGVWPLVEPITNSTVYASHDPEVFSARLEDGNPNYSRDHFPNTRTLESLIADLEGADEGYAVSSGMAAISLVALALMSSGDHVVLGIDSYCDAEHLFTSELPRFGIECSLVDMADSDAIRAAIRPETRMIYAETITNPGMNVADIPQLATIARQHQLALIIDNTFASPALCQPIAHGADLVIHSVTKFLGGHHDLSAGVVVGSSRLMNRIQQFGYLLGAALGATDAAMAVRGIRTLVPRMMWISDSALQVATWLDRRPEIAAVRYPGLAPGTGGELAARMLPDGYGGVVVAEFGGADAGAAATSFVRALELVPYAPSLGGDITTVCYPPRFHNTHGDQSRHCDRTLRFSIGLEHPSDLIADLEQALERAAKHNVCGA